MATSADGLRDAWARLQEESRPGTRFVLKPAAEGGKVMRDVGYDDLANFDFGAYDSAILEELVVGRGPKQSPTLYMIGNAPCGRLADQVLLEDGVTKVGVRYPSRTPADLLAVCTNAAQRLNSILDLTGPWSLDFVLGHRGDPIIVDFNTGRPSGHLSIRFWASRLSPDLCIQTGSWLVPSSCDPGIRKIYSALRHEKLLWNGREGVVVYQHVPGSPSSFAVASCFGDKAVGSLLRALAKLMLERFSAEIMTA